MKLIKTKPKTLKTMIPKGFDGIIIDVFFGKDLFLKIVMVYNDFEEDEKDMFYITRDTRGLLDPINFRSCLKKTLENLDMDTGREMIIMIHDTRGNRGGKKYEIGTKEIQIRRIERIAMIGYLKRTRRNELDSSDSEGESDYGNIKL
jgi:hypothetical protein